MDIFLELVLFLTDHNLTMLRLYFQKGGVGMGWALPGMNELKDRAKVSGHVCSMGSCTA
jgi:hypothetical protein